MATYTFRFPGRDAGKTITVYDATNTQVASGAADANGVFTASLASGDYYALAPDGQYRRGDSDSQQSVESAALSATYVRRRANTIALLGDSITERNLKVTSSTVQYYSAEGYWTWATQALRRRLKLVKVAGVVGETSAQILARVQSDVVALAPSYCFVLAGANDANGGTIPAATTIANLATIYDQLTTAGIEIIAGTVLPITAGTAATVDTINKWLREQSLTRRNFTLVDWAPLLTTASTGAFVAALTNDGLHPNPKGAQIMGKEAARVLGSVLKPAADPLPASNADASNVFTNGMMLGNVSGAPTGVSIFADGTTPSVVFAASKVVRTDGKPGEWAQVAITTTGYVITNVSAINATLTPGDQYQLAVEYERDANWSGVTIFQARLLSVGGTTATMTDGLSSTGLPLSDTDVPMSGVLETPPLTIQSGNTGLRFYLDFKGLGTVRWGRVYMRKVS